MGVQTDELLTDFPVTAWANHHSGLSNLVSDLRCCIAGALEPRPDALMKRCPLTTAGPIALLA